MLLVNPRRSMTCGKTLNILWMNKILTINKAKNMNQLQYQFQYKGMNNIESSSLGRSRGIRNARGTSCSIITRELLTLDTRISEIGKSSS
jgi:hypothetical protein